MMKTIFCLLTALFVLSAGTYAQNQSDYNFQQTYKQIQKVLDKEARGLSDDEANQLRNFAKIGDDEFGVKYQNTMRDIKNRIKVKIAEYDNLKKEKEYSTQKEKELSTTQEQYKITQDTLQSVKKENAELLKTIQELNARIKTLDRERSKLRKANSDLQNQNKQTQQLLAQSQRTVQNIIGLIGRNPALNEQNVNIPKEQVDSLHEAECSVANLLKDNYILTLRRMENDQPFLDSSRAYYKKNNRLPQNINDYVTSGNEIITRLRGLNTDCAQKNADEINEAIMQFTDMIQNTHESFWAKVGQFFTSVPGIIIIVLIVGLAVFFITRSSTKKKV